MSKRFNGIFIAVSVILYIVAGSTATMAQERLMESTDIPVTLANIIAQLPADIDPTLPAPEMIPEPPYTWGSVNTVYWHGDSTRQLLDSLSLDLLFFEIEAKLDTIVRWSPMPARADSAIFADLPTGVRVDYRLRYFAQDTLGSYLMSYWSPTTWSIQDSSAPSLDSLAIVNLQESDGVRWVVGQTIDLHITASDPHGQVMQVVIHEESEAVDDTLFHPLVPPVDSVSTTIPYTFNTLHQIPTKLNVWVIDVAGQKSETLSDSLFWWLEEPGDKPMICFPNPFTPEVDEIITIKVNIPDVQEARIFDPFGNLVRVLQKKSNSDLFFEWDGKNGVGRAVATGGYVCMAPGKKDVYCKIAVLR